MLDWIVWLMTGWLAGIAVAAALGVRSHRRLVWNGVLGLLMSSLAGWLLAPAFNMPTSGTFNLGAASVAVVAAILLCLLGNFAAWCARLARRNGSEVAA